MRVTCKKCGAQNDAKFLDYKCSFCGYVNKIENFESTYHRLKREYLRLSKECQSWFETCGHFKDAKESLTMSLIISNVVWLIVVAILSFIK